MEFERDVLVSPTQEVPVVEGEVVLAIRALADRRPEPVHPCSHLEALWPVAELYAVFAISSNDSPFAASAPISVERAAESTAAGRSDADAEKRCQSSGDERVIAVLTASTQWSAPAGTATVATLARGG